MKAARIYGFNGPLIIEEMVEPELKKSEVLVRVKACAIASGEFSVILGRRKQYYGGEFIFPHVPGYQGVGIVEEVFSDIQGWHKGERVIVNGLISCGKCEHCKEGLDNLCAEHKLIGIDSGTQGCFAEYVSVQSRNLIRLSENIPFEQAVLISEAGVIYHAYAKMKQDQLKSFSVAIFGCGRMGPITVGGSRAFGADFIIIVDRHTDRLELARKAGADVMINSLEEDPLEKILHLTNGKGVNVAIEFTGSEDMIVNAIRSTGHNGKVFLIGIRAPVVLQLPTYYKDVIQKENNIIGCLGKTSSEFRLTAEMVGSGKLNLSKIPIKIFPFNQIVEAWKMATERKTAERIVLSI